ncbi:MAG: hypothetical protein A2Z12_06095 [Actinobacteria bacterium RBG_16_68_21]|nr:MAG: hypothetical protein A2Z12_06095 [Actinobacteria bacterium RBG_16_68_21]
MTDDREWLERMWSLHAGKVYAYAARRIGRAAAEDVVADTFVVAWRNRRRRPARELPWLYGVARRVVADRRRGEDRRRRLLDRIAAEPGGHDSPSEAAYAALEALGRLAPGDSEALMLTAWEGLTPTEAAAALGVTSASFRMRLSRARRRLLAEMSSGDEVS